MSEEIKVNAKEFLTQLRQVSTAVAKTDFRPVLTMVHVRIKENELIIEATDAHRLEQRRVNAEVPTGIIDKVFFLSEKFAKNISKSTTKLGKELTIIPGLANENQKFVEPTKIVDKNGEIHIDEDFNPSYISTTFGENYYPELDGLIPDTNKVSFKVKAADLKKAVRDWKKLVKENDVEEASANNLVVLKVGENVKFGGYKHFTELPVSEVNKEEELSIKFNFKYLFDAIKKLSNSDEITYLGSQDELKKVRLLSKKQEGTTVIMPIRYCGEEAEKEA